MTSGANVLVVDDESEMRDMLTALLGEAGFATRCAPDGGAAIALAEQQPFDAAVVDLMLPDTTGIQTIRRLRGARDATAFVILTGHASVDTAIEAVREDVYDYLLKPTDIRRLPEVVGSAISQKRRGSESSYEAKNVSRVNQLHRSSGAGSQDRLRPPIPVLVGDSRSMTEIRRQVTALAPTDLTVLIRGETGTGKDVVARLIHQLSWPRNKQPFHKVNCPAVPENLFESEMFGHERGAYTGAESRRLGRFEMAAGGTLFLDEVGAISPAVQAKLLEVAEGKTFMRIGGAEQIHADARILAATNAPVEDMARSGAFRPDLLYRLSQATVTLPPLRERREDIPVLVEHFLDRCSSEANGRVPALSASDMAALEAYDWPGNVRELESVIKRFVALGCPLVLHEALAVGPDASTAAPCPCALEQCEAGLVRSALERSGWNQRLAARHLGLSYSALRRRMAKHGLERPGS